jgi:hypothetical protein
MLRFAIAAVQDSIVPHCLSGSFGIRANLDATTQQTRSKALAELAGGGRNASSTVVARCDRLDRLPESVGALIASSRP